MALDLGVSTELLELLERRDQRGTQVHAAWPAYASWSERTELGWTVLHRVPLDDLVRDSRILLETMDRIEETLRAHASHPHSDDRAPLSISLPAFARTGFDIDLHICDGRIDASFGGLEQEFGDAATAMVWVRRALSDHYRLAITCVDDVPCEWRLEPIECRHPPGFELAGGRMPLLGRFKRRRTSYRCNATPAHLLLQ